MVVTDFIRYFAVDATLVHFYNAHVYKDIHK